MKKVIALLLMTTFVSNIAWADCDFSTVTKNSNGTYTYPEACHLKVGQLVQDNVVKTQQIADLTKAISLKDLAIKASDARAQLWMTTSGNLEDRLQKVDKLEKSNEWLFFGLGALTIIGAGVMTASLIHK